MNNLFYSLITFVIAIFFIMLGMVSMMIPWFSGVRTDLIQFILEDSLTISLFGLGFLIIGLAIATNVILSMKRRHYYIRSDNRTVSVDETIIEEYLNSYWKQLFPDREIPCHLVLKKNVIYIHTDLPHLPNSQQKLLLDRIKTDLRNMFAKFLGYHREFHLYASFQSEMKNKATEKL
jgi:hypothetical protein